tara:strand:+ start:171 stop:533 length:363 start_codon:yes stop_codon:yes gene_type:complete
MKIYEHLTFLSHDCKEALNFYKKNKNEKINILYSFKSVLWQGPSLIKDIENNFKRKSINFIVEANLNIGLALSLVRLNFRYISLSQKMDDEITKKIQSIAKEKKVTILFTENFLNLENYS